MKTALEFFRENTALAAMDIDVTDDNTHTIYLMRQFAKYHVEKALNAAAEKTKICKNYYINGVTQAVEKEFDDGLNRYYINKDSILNAYNLDNIK